MTPRSLSATLALLALLAPACKDADRYRRVSKAEWELDASRPRDGAPEDGARTVTLPDGRVVSLDELLDGSLSDSGLVLLPDGRVIDPDGGAGDGPDGGDAGGDGGFEPEPDVHACSVGGNESYELPVPFVEGGFGLAPGPIGFGLATLKRGSCKNAIEGLRIDSGSGAVTPGIVMDGCDTVRELALTSTPDAWYLAWTDNSTGSIEVHAAQLDGEMRLPAVAETPTALSNSPQFEHSPALTSVAGMPMAAWIAEENETRTIFTRMVGQGDAIVAVPGDDHIPIEIALSSVGTENAVLGWVEEVASRGIWVQPLDGSAQPQGAPVRLTDYAAPGSTVSIATRDRVDDGGAVAYSAGIDDVNFEVRFRRLFPDGQPRGSELKVISRPLQGKDAGIAALGGGYVIAYRALPDGVVVKQTEIRLVFVSKDGNLARDTNGRVTTFPVAPAARDGSRIQIAVSVDGQLLLAFVDGNDAGENLLRVIQKRLDCPL